MSQNLSIVFLMASVVGLGCAEATHESPPFRIGTKRQEDKVEVEVDKDTAIFSIHSPFGIGLATIRRTNEKWPESVMLRLHLKGLESFKATNSRVALAVSVTSHDDKPQFRLWKNGAEDALLDSGSLHWMEIRMVGSDGKPATAIPLQDGYFEMTLPKAFFEGNPHTIQLNWIDFYR